MLWLTSVAAAGASRADDIPKPVAATVLDQSDRDADQVYGRMLDVARTQYNTATGAFITRTTNAAKDTQVRTAAHLEAVKEQLRKSADEEMRLIRESGGTPDPEKYRRNAEKTLKDLEGKLAPPVTTEILRYFVSGHKVRLERQKAPDDLPLEEIKRRVLSKTLDTRYPTISVWDGSESLHVIQEMDGTAPDNDAKVKGFASIKKNKELAVPDVIGFGRLEAGKDGVPTLLASLRREQIPVTARERKAEGERQIVVQAGTPGNILLDGNMVVLPDKGYTMRSAQFRVRGALMSREDYTGHMKTALGFWMPTQGLRESYAPDKQGVVSLHTRTEFLAYEDPQFDAAIDPTVFDLRNDRAFKEARLMADRPPPEELVATVPVQGSRRRWLYALALPAPLLILAAVWYRKRQAEPANQPLHANSGEEKTHPLTGRAS